MIEAETIEQGAVPTTAEPGRRVTAALLVAGGLLMAGGQLHPIGSGDTVEAHLLSMFSQPDWTLAHVVLLLGAVVSATAFVTAHRTQAFGPSLQRWLPAVAIAWWFGAVEAVPHLLAVHDADALAQHHATPVLDLHVLLQIVATPAIGLTGAFVAVAVARAARTRAAWVLAVAAVVGGLAYAVAGPLVVATGDPRFTILFPFQAGLALWLIGTGIRLIRR